MANKKKTKRRSKQREVVKVPTYLAENPAMPLMQAVQWFIQKIDTVRGKDDFRSLLADAEKILFPRLKAMIAEGTNAEVLQAGGMVLEMRRLEIRREAPVMKVLEQCLVSLATLEMAQMAALVEQPDLDLRLLRPTPARQRALVHSATEMVKAKNGA